MVSIFGKAGEGKSHTLNQCFFDGSDTFCTSSGQDNGTRGVWAAYDPNLQVIILDTEGMLGMVFKVPRTVMLGEQALTTFVSTLGTSHNENRRTRLLMKVLAVSDIVVVKSKAERLHNDLFRFLGDSSKAFNERFSDELSTKNKGGSEDGDVGDTSVGPAVIISHETKDTDVLSSSK